MLYREPSVGGRVRDEVVGWARLAAVTGDKWLNTICFEGRGLTCYLHR